MASHGPGKHRERKTRSSKPYERPKGIIRRVTDSVSGLFSASWLSGWMGAEEEEEESSEPQPGPSTLAPPGESFIFAHPASVTARRTFRPFYPEEGETDNNREAALGINEGASTSSSSSGSGGVRIGIPPNNTTNTSSTSAPPPPPPGGITVTVSPRVPQLSVEGPGAPLGGRRLPIISSTPATMFAPRPKGQMGPRGLPLLTTSTPACDDGSEMSESSAETGVDVDESVIPRPDERDYQREILQLDEESLQTLRDSLSKPVPSSPLTQPCPATLPTLDETRKRTRDMDQDHSSIRAEGSVSSKSLFSEAGDLPRGRPQPSALASKRPRFNVSIYGSPILSDKSVLSDSSFKASPFYPGRTMYGGASAYRRRLPTRASHQALVKPKAPSASTEDGGLSQAARRILESLESMSTPISDAKRIPTPTPGQRGSFLDSSSYTTAFHRHQRSHPRPSAPPSSKLFTPSKVTVQENLSGSLANSLPLSNPSTSQLPGDSTFSRRGSRREDPSPSHTLSEARRITRQREQSGLTADNSSNSNSPSISPNISHSTAASIFSKAAAETMTTSKSAATTQITTTTTTTPTQSLFKFGASGNNKSSFEFTPKPPSAAPPSDFSQPANRIGKMKSKLVDSGRASNRQEEEEAVEEPSLPSVPLPLPLPSLPKINFLMPSAGYGSQSKLSSSPQGFKFSIPEIVDVHSASTSLDKAPNFTFRNPTLIGEGKTISPKTTPTLPLSTTTTTKQQPSLMFNCSSTSLAGPKLKMSSSSKAVVSSDKLKEGSILDVLKPKEKVTDKSPLSSPSPTSSSSSSSSPQSNDGKTVVSSKVFSLTNSNSPKSAALEPVNSTMVKRVDAQGFGTMFKRSSDEWECSVCMLRNKGAVVKCVACEAQRPDQGKGKGQGQGASSPSNKSGSVGSLGSGAGWGGAFRKSSSDWDCDTCMVRNKDSAVKCVACETPRPGAKAESSKSMPGAATESKAKTSTTTGFSGFGSAFTKQKGEWECDTCLVRNKSDAARCVSCETPKPGAANISEAITGNFKFGLSTTSTATTTTTANPATASESPSLGSGFVFGKASEKPDVSGGFKFGVSGAKSKQEEEGEIQGSTGFKFGVAAEKTPNALPVAPTFGVSAESDKPKDKVATSSFTFGVPKITVNDKPEETQETKKSSAVFGGNSSLSAAVSSESVTSTTTTTTTTTPVFQFGAGPTKPHVAFTFNSGSQDKVNEQPKLVNASPSVETKPSPVQVEEAKNFKPSESIFSRKEGTVVPGTTKPAFTFNSIASPNKEDGTSISSAPVASPFGALVNREPPAPSPSPAPPAAAAPTATSTAALTVPFGGNSGASTTTSGNVFGFGDKAATPSTFPFSFSSPQPSANKEENKPTQAPAFTFSSKVDSSDTSEPAKKLSFSTPSFGGSSSINNGVSASPSLFTFGSKENKLGTSGTGFGTPPASTPAFGAPAPAPNATPTFQFGNSNPPARAATAPTAFGTPSPAFGSSVNSNSGFAFGQSAEKKSSTGFDFGQAASSTGPSFNFASAVQPQQNSGNMFQFGQSQTNNASPGVFQFGSRNAEVPAPAAFGNNENPFSPSPAPPSGRVVRKAVRRTKK